jgi:hypothetical protein
VSTGALEHTLNETLARLERVLLAPVLSGELKTWVANVQQAAATFALDWTRYLHSVLHVQYAQIAATDPELLTFVEKMKQADQELLEELARFHESLDALARAAAVVERDENKLSGMQKKVEQAGIDLILKIKKQRAAAATWLTEAVYRDRGVVD